MYDEGRRLVERIKTFLFFVLKNFGPILGFYILNHFLGYRIATIASLLLVLLDYVLLKKRKEKLTMLFWALNSVIVVFGILDLFLSNQLFIKYEAFLTNTIIAIFWTASLFKEKSIVQEIAESQGRIDPTQSVDKKYFFNIFTILWSSYFFLKGIFYLWTYQNSSFENALMVRIFIGKISLWIMIGISTLLPKKIWKFMEWLKMFPSQKNLLVIGKE